MAQTVRLTIEVPADVLEQCTHLLASLKMTAESAVEQLFRTAAEHGEWPISGAGEPVARAGEAPPAILPASRTEYFERKVEEALEDRRPSVPHEEVQRQWAFQREEFMRKHGIRDAA